MKRLIPLLLLLIPAALDLLSGNGLSLPGKEVFWQLRLPRMAAALLCGGAMGIAGAQMQALFRNPLADPHLMGISGGAGLGASLAAIGLGAGVSASTGTGALVASAFAGALVGSAIIVGVSLKVRSTATLLLCGVMLGFVCSALGSIAQYSAGEESLKLYYSWLSGSFSTVGTRGLGLLAFALAAGFIMALADASRLDLVLFGDEFAASAGVSMRGIRLRTMLSTSIMAGAVTAFCGPVGFVGLAAPHLARRIAGTSVHRQVLPSSMLTGAGLALFADAAAHIGAHPIPVGSTMALVGIPLVIILLWRQRL